MLLLCNKSSNIMPSKNRECVRGNRVMPECVQRCSNIETVSTLLCSLGVAVRVAGTERYLGTLITTAGGLEARADNDLCGGFHSLGSEFTALGSSPHFALRCLLMSGFHLGWTPNKASLPLSPMPTNRNPTSSATFVPC